MNILIAPDSFKNCLTAQDVCHNIYVGFKSVFPKATYHLVPLSDGGEGIADCIINACNGKKKHLNVYNPLNKEIAAYYGIYNNKNAIIEMALASGLELLKTGELNPEFTTTYGTGQLIADAINSNCNKIVIGIGGSATNDGGIGMAAALGFKFLNKKGDEIKPIGANLIHIDRIIFPKTIEAIQEKEIIIASDVKNPLLGKSGATYTFAEQKGASPEQILALEKGLENLAHITFKETGIDYAANTGAGAAGGLGFGLMAFLGGKMMSGFDFVSQEIDLYSHIKQADLIITGEGKIDYQTHFGKLPFAVGRLAKLQNKKLIAFCGTLDTKKNDPIYDTVSHIVPIIDKPMELSYALSHAETLLKKAAKRTALMLQLGMQF